MPQLGRMSPFPGVKLRVSRRNGPRRNPQNRVEGIHRIEAAVEPEYEFIEVCLQMTRFDTSVVGAIDPCLQIGEDKMDHRQMLFRLFRVATEGELIVFITHSGKVVISLPAVSLDNGAWRHIVPDECGERFGVATGKRNVRLFGIGNNSEPEAPRIGEFFYRNALFVGILPFRATIIGVLARPHFDSANYCCLMVDPPSFAPRATANTAFVYFDGMRRPDSIAVWSHHTSAEFVKHRECRLIRSNIKLALKLDGGLARRLCRHEISAPKPRRERHMARLHNRPGSERRILFASTAAQYNRRTRSEAVRLADVPALLASEAVRPANRLQITGASAVIREDALKFRKARGEGCIHV